ncbi:MAG: hypothetical protein M1820_007954 [Bogoriella megaspora]|nr:MAG: hypothetical protein M1820_007954 [Bogoriella megaspora]
MSNTYSNSYPNGFPRPNQFPPRQIYPELNFIKVKIHDEDDYQDYAAEMFTKFKDANVVKQVIQMDMQKQVSKLEEELGNTYRRMDWNPHHFATEAQWRMAKHLDRNRSIASLSTLLDALYPDPCEILQETPRWKRANQKWEESRKESAEKWGEPYVPKNYERYRNSTKVKLSKQPWHPWGHVRAAERFEELEESSCPHCGRRKRGRDEDSDEEAIDRPRKRKKASEPPQPPKPRTPYTHVPGSLVLPTSPSTDPAVAPMDDINKNPEYEGLFYEADGVPNSPSRSGDVASPSNAATRADVREGSQDKEANERAGALSPSRVPAPEVQADEERAQASLITPPKEKEEAVLPNIRTNEPETPTPKTAQSSEVHPSQSHHAVSPPPPPIAVEQLPQTSGGTSPTPLSPVQTPESPPRPVREEQNPSPPPSPQPIIPAELPGVLLETVTPNGRKIRIWETKPLAGSKRKRSKFDDGGAEEVRYEKRMKLR